MREITFVLMIKFKEINDNNQIALFYSDENGIVNEQCNPNGSLQNIAGVFNKQKNVPRNDASP